MATDTGRAKFPARVMIQMSLELEAQLRDLADREYAGQLQTLVRQCLLSRVAEDECKQDVPDVGQSLEQLRQDLLDVMARLEHRVDILSTGMVSLPTNMNNLDRELAAHKEVLEKLRGTPDAVSLISRHQGQQAQLLDQQTQVLDQQTQVLEQTQVQHTKALGLHSRLLAQMKGTLDNLAQVLLVADDSDEQRGGLMRRLRRT